MRLFQMVKGEWIDCMDIFFELYAFIILTSTDIVDRRLFMSRK